MNIKTFSKYLFYFLLWIVQVFVSIKIPEIKKKKERFATKKKEKREENRNEKKERNKKNQKIK